MLCESKIPEIVYRGLLCHLDDTDAHEPHGIPGHRDLRE
jgi:hypothetical protein